MLSPMSANQNLVARFLHSALPERTGLGQSINTSYSTVTNQQMPSTILLFLLLTLVYKNVSSYVALQSSSLLDWMLPNLSITDKAKDLT